MHLIFFVNDDEGINYILADEEDKAASLGSVIESPRRKCILSPAAEK